MRIGILTALWQRRELARVVMTHHANLQIPDVELVPLAVGSEGKASRDLAHECGYHYVAARNHPVSDKLNKGMQAFASAGVDAVVVTDSDDLLNAAYFEHVAGKIAEGNELIELRGIYFYSAITDDLVYADAWSTGVGRCFSSSLLRRRRWTGWQPGMNKMLNSGQQVPLIQWANPRAWVPDLRKTEIRVVDIKTGHNIWTFEQCVDEICRPDRRHPIPDTRAWFERHFPGTYDRIHEHHHPTP